MLLLDANVIVTGVAGRSDGASALLLATIRLGGLAGCTVENALEEARRHLLELFNRNRLKISPVETDRELAALRQAPTFTVYPWVSPRPGLWPENPKDAYLLVALEEHRPTWLLTWDQHLLALGAHAGAQILTPPAFLAQLESTEL
jgi:predicted nucleic acid-binding protein